MTTITGHDAIAHAAATGATLRKYADPVDGAREVTLDEARTIAAEDAGLVWCEAPADDSPAALWTEISALSVADAEAAYIALRDRREALYAAAHQRHARGLGTREATVRDEVEAQRAASEEHAATDLRAHLLSRRIPGLHAVGCSLCAKVSA